MSDHITHYATRVQVKYAKVDFAVKCDGLWEQVEPFEFCSVGFFIMRGYRTCFSVLHSYSLSKYGSGCIDLYHYSFCDGVIHMRAYYTCFDKSEQKEIRHDIYAVFSCPIFKRY